jgi:hypothetical protein
MKNILITHPNFVGFANKISKESDSIVIGNSNCEEVLESIKKGDVEKLGIIFETRGMNVLDFIKKAYSIDQTLPILVLNCPSLHFEELADYPELLEDNIFFVDCSDFKDDPFFELLNKFFSESLTKFDVEILERVEN